MPPKFTHARPVAWGNKKIAEFCELSILSQSGLGKEEESNLEKYQIHKN
jgi:hypothetical protein